MSVVKPKNTQGKPPFTILTVCLHNFGRAPSYATEITQQLSGRFIDFGRLEQKSMILQTQEGGFPYRILLRSIRAKDKSSLSFDELEKADLVVSAFGDPNANDNIKTVYNMYRRGSAEKFAAVSRENRLISPKKDRITPENARNILERIRRHARRETT